MQTHIKSQQLNKITTDDNMHKHLNTISKRELFMSLKTSIQNLRADMKIRQEAANAQLQAASDSIRSMPMFGVMFALGFAFLLMSLAGIAAPVQAGTLNDSVGPIIEDVATLFTPILALVIAAVPVIIATGMIGFILGVLATIVGKMHL